MSNRAALAALLLTDFALVIFGCARAAPLPTHTTLAFSGVAELAIQRDGVALPIFSPEESPAALCLSLPEWVDARQWRGRLRPAAAFRQPVARVGNVLCFDLPPPDSDSDPDSEPRDENVCLELEDTYDGSRRLAPCRRVRWSNRVSCLAPLRERFASILGREPMKPWDPLRRELLNVADHAEAEGCPVLAANVRLAVAHKDRRRAGSGDLARAGAILDQPPPWLHQPAAGAVAATWSFERGLLERALRGPSAAGWAALRAAESAFAGIADARRATVILEQAVWLGELGDVESARRRALSTLPEGPLPTPADALPWSTWVDLAWVLLLDPEADDAVLERAEDALLAALASPSLAGDPLEHANTWINLAWARLRRGGDWQPCASRARALLAGLEGAGIGGERRRFLLGWAELVESLAALRVGAPSAGIPRDAVERCGRLAASASDAGLRAAAWSCLGRGERARGRPRQALQAFERAVALSEALGRDHPELELRLGPSARAQTFFEAARVAVELGLPQYAWSLLDRLDALGSNEPADGTGRPELSSARLGPAYRAFALGDEVILLERAAGGEVLTPRRTPLPHSTVSRLRAEPRFLATAIEEEAWRRSLAPLAHALWPGADHEAGALAVYTLHGWLQDVPLAALPAPPGSAGRWLADVATVALGPARVGPARVRPGSDEPEALAPVFVVDPDGSLPFAAGAAESWRALFPQARVLRGEEATASTVAAAVASATLLHVDAHGEYDPAFPEQSALVLADARWRPGAGALPVHPRWLVNLSGCRTGRWPITADGGTYGLAGLFLRAGARWAIASRDGLDDRLASEFNQQLYGALSRGATVPVAYATAHEAIRRRASVGRWAGWMLLTRDS